VQWPREQVIYGETESSGRVTVTAKKFQFLR
jgi:hypothetical protein